MDWHLVIAGGAIGLALAVPVGPINLMCIQRTVQHGFWSGVATGIGAAAGDGLFAVIGAFGITWLTTLIEGNRLWIQGVGGVIVLIMGARTFFQPPSDHAPGVDLPWLHHGGLIGTTFLLTITNPATLLGYIAAFSGVKGIIASPDDYTQASVLVGAVVGGSFLWWVIVAWVVTKLRRGFTETGMRWINRVSGVVIFLFGILVVIDMAGVRVFNSLH
jgi:threonine/homoserine/homoserine lactone efflux protein